MLPRLTRHYLGIYEGGQLSGVVLLGWGTQPLQTIRKIFPAHDLTTASYLEIGKMCFLPELNHTGYFGSLALSALIRWVRDNTGCLFLYTLADGIMGKCGYVYQAANFRYLGHFTTSVYRDTATGEKIHPRSAGQLLSENAALEGVAKKNWLTHEFCAANVLAVCREIDRTKYDALLLFGNERPGDRSTLEPLAPDGSLPPDKLFTGTKKIHGAIW